MSCGLIITNLQFNTPHISFSGQVLEASSIIQDDSFGQKEQLGVDNIFKLQTMRSPAPFEARCFDTVPNTTSPKNLSNG